MARRVHQVELIGLAVGRLPFEPHRLGLDGDPALALDVHIVEHLLVAAHLAVGEAAGGLDQPVGERRLAVVDMGDDAEIADLGDVGHWSRAASRRVEQCQQAWAGASARNGRTDHFRRREAGAYQGAIKCTVTVIAGLAVVQREPSGAGRRRSHRDPRDARARARLRGAARGGRGHGGVRGSGAESVRAPDRVSGVSRRAGMAV